ncbi:MAG: UvrD-helicase domain-containing protein, partial [Burkholderiales bacterium]|nr:UvrD-helicase domain-containing protein [Burkholderiales bacterium]
MSERLDPLTLPLQGSRLIEASAGTGKTWTVAALVLRLVLGHGGTNGFARALAPAEILVMTFTRAATRELADRIRERLIEATRVFRAEAEPGAQDLLLAELLAAYPAGTEREAAAWRLDSAARSMDEAAVHTIDAWCQRMLREHAFDSGSLFDEELAADERELLRQATRDFWRQQVYPLEGAALEQVLALWPQVDRLERDASALRRHELQAQQGAADLAQLVAALGTERASALAQLKQGWSARAAAMQAWIDERLAEKDCAFDKKKLHPRHYLAWFETLRAWAEDPLADRLELTPAASARLRPQGLHDALRPGRSIEPPAAFAEFEALMQALAALPDPAAALRLHAAAAISRRVAALQEQAGRFGFADLLQRLDAALDPARNGEAAARLRRRILAQYPVALVDEFQDTSPIQARIFGRLYDIGANDPATALLLIGDPKQSIYAFR